MLNIVKCFTALYVDAAGDATTVVVVAVVIDAVFVLPGVITLEALSTHDAWTSTAVALPVMTLITSEVLDSIIILESIDYRVTSSTITPVPSDIYSGAASTAPPPPLPPAPPSAPFVAAVIVAPPPPPPAPPFRDEALAPAAPAVGLAPSVP